MEPIYLCIDAYQRISTCYPGVLLVCTAAELCACSAVDNILLRLRAAGLPVLRLGRPASVHPSLRDCLPGGALWPDSSVAALRSLPRRAGVVRSLSQSLLADLILESFRFDSLNASVLMNCASSFTGSVSSGIWEMLSPHTVDEHSCFSILVD